ncbi:unknown protein (plasmid) [Nostoc sp. NIES-3756]|uniref:LlaJI family restriction endonuclease n=1 Tax=Nostoc sp. NIES-3756 TaxID=1751286 RepID=UPI00072145D5|nr:LlaJI family restriction endonuclease [Nostoc sp. NIES-3756]BAT57013.1 unknown protein [Nostoc sp. NIES-3756]
MFDFSELELVKVKDAHDNFVGIRKSKSGKNFEFCLPNGFENFPNKDFNKIRDLFFYMYRTFAKFERDNLGNERFKVNKPEYQQEQDQTTISSSGVSLQTEEGQVCVLYSKIKMIEKILEAYDDLAIHSIQKKIGRSDKIDYSRIHKYLDKAIYLEQDVIYVESMDLPRSLVRYESTDIVNLYCYILDEIVKQLQDDVPDKVKKRSQDIQFLAQRFKDNYLTSNQSIFDKETYAETINILKDSLDKIDKNTYYKDADYWGIYEAVEIFLYGEINSNQNDGEYWGIKGFSLVWEDMCHTYFFNKYRDEICFADTDIPLKDPPNPSPERKIENKKMVGNLKFHNGNGYGNQWIYRSFSDIKCPNTDIKYGWNELLCIEFNPSSRMMILSNSHSINYPQIDRSKLLRRFPRPDIVLKGKNFIKEGKVRIIDYKDVPLEFYVDENIAPNSSSKKYNDDIIKQLTYELALQQTHTVSSNWFFIPYYYEETPSPNPLGEIAFKIKKCGIDVFKANFFLIQQIYLEENV